MFFPGDFLAKNLEPELLSTSDLHTQKYYADMYNKGPAPSNEQREAIEKFMKAAEDLRNLKEGKQTDLTQRRHFFITGEAGCGKTFTYNVKFFIFFLFLF